MLRIVVVVLIMVLAVSSSTPSVDCDAEVSKTGKKYHEIYEPHETDCNRFYQCTDHGLEELRCNRGLVFFPYLNGCVDKKSDNCITSNMWRSLKP